ncbi:MAG: RNA polymerase sigma factor [Roseburia sp.]
MEDEKIVELYWERNPMAITVTGEKYQNYCFKIAYNILQNQQDCEECVNDTWFRAWNAMPTERPKLLGAFLGAITRNLSLDCYRKRHTKRRGEGEITYVFEELQDCISTAGPEQKLEEQELVKALNRFLENMEKESRMIFVRRYWYMDSVAGIAARFSMSESKVKSSLFRARKKLYAFLKQEGFEVEG